MGEAYSMGKIASALIGTTDEVHFYEVPDNAEINGKMFLANMGTSAVTVSVAWCDRGHGDQAAEGKDWVLKGKSLEAGQTYEIRVTMGGLETLRIQASSPNVLAVTLVGVKKTMV